MPKKSELVIHVLFDSNIIFTEAPSLVHHKIKELIHHSNSAAHEVIWYLADTVRGERRFQMARRAGELFSSVRKLEKLIEQRSALTRESIEASLDETMQKQIRSLGLTEIKLDVSEVDWSAVFNNALKRELPFETETEKGFRDSMLLETFAQLVNQLTPKQNRIYCAFRRSASRPNGSALSSSSFLPRCGRPRSP